MRFFAAEFIENRNFIPYDNLKIFAKDYIFVSIFTSR